MIAGRPFRLLLALFLGAWTTPALADQYLCLAELATGFQWDGERWVSAELSSDHSYLVREVAPFEPYGDGRVYQYKVDLLGEQVDFFFACSNRVLTAEVPTILCGSERRSMTINTETLRFIYQSVGSFVAGNDARAAAPVMEIGRCRPL